jgi:DNA-binding Lrp family transcriptional regulator
MANPKYIAARFGVYPRPWFEGEMKPAEMDDTDMKLLLLIAEDPRMSLKELARRLGISRQATNNRMQVLAKFGIFKSLKANISVAYEGGLVFPWIWGISRAASINDTLTRLGENDSTSSVCVLGANELLVYGCLKDGSELIRYVEFVKRVAEMPEANVGLVCYDDGIMPDWASVVEIKRCKGISPLDARIIALLHDNMRMPAAEIAKCVGISTKTVTRHIERMKSEGSIDWSISFDYPAGKSMVTVVYLNLKSSADKVKVGRRLLSKFPLRLVAIRSFSNIQDLLAGFLYSNDMSETRRILKGIGEDEDVLSVTPNLIYLEREYETCWWDKELRILAGSFDMARQHYTRLKSKDM